MEEHREGGDLTNMVEVEDLNFKKVAAKVRVKGREGKSDKETVVLASLIKY